MSVKDPSGNPLKLVLLQIIDSDEQGPITLRARLDDEQISLANERQRKFLMVWTAVDNDCGLVDLANVYQEFEILKAQNEVRKETKAQLDRDIANIQRDVERLERENKDKTEELRQLHKERDPERIAVLVAHSVKERTATLEDQIRAQATEKANLQREIDELRASKRRLKEANERLKDGRK